MAASHRSILVVEDDDGLRELLVDELSSADYQVEAVDSAEQALRYVETHQPALVLSDLRLPGQSGLQLLERIQSAKISPRPAFILVTAFGSIPEAVRALKLGADEFLTKPLDLDHLLVRVERIFEVEALRRQVKSWRKIEQEGVFHDIIGRSPAMSHLFFQVRKIARAKGSVLIVGESGTGKELVTRAIHAEGRGETGPFVPVNCAGVPEALLESEFFGHAEGAFTGASGPRRGLFEQADGGTILLDEVGDLPMGLQAKLLRALQEQRIRPVGQNEPIDIDVRVVAATNRDLDEAVEEGTFREDLFYRLSTFILRVPPLRKRREDIEALATAFLREVKERSEQLDHVEGFDETVIELFRSYRFPGNVRELKNLVERAATFCDEALISVHHLPERFQEFAAEAPMQLRDLDELAERLLAQGRLVTMDELRNRYAEFVVEHLDGNKRSAAKVLGISRSTLYRYLPDVGE
jgi:two-component system, NtrC family, response regulator AtoC